MDVHLAAPGAGRKVKLNTFRELVQRANHGSRCSVWRSERGLESGACGHEWPVAGKVASLYFIFPLFKKKRRKKSFLSL